MLAGTPQSETSPTQNTEQPGELIAGAVYLVNFGSDGVYVDTYINVTPLISNTWKELLDAGKLHAVGLAAQDTIVKHINLIRMRARFVSTDVPGPFFIRTRAPLTKGILEQHLRSLSREELADFLETSRL